MKAFAALYAQLDASTSTLDKVAALRGYFARAMHEAPSDAAWAAYFLAGGRPRQAVPTALLRRLACEVAGIDEWLFEESYQAVGDLAETIAHVLPPPTRGSMLSLNEWLEQRLLPLRGRSPELQSEAVRGWWDELEQPERFLLVKLIGGGFRVGVSKLLVQRALAEEAGLDAKLVAQRMMGYTDAKRAPDAARFMALLAPPQHGAPREAGEPYPFFLAHPLEGGVESFEARLGAPSQWLVEWKFDGIRAQLVKRAGQVWLWSRGEELVTERFPEVASHALALPDGSVLDGELMAWQDDRAAPIALLQRRIGRKTLGPKLLAEAPVRFVAYDLLEWAGEDLRTLTQFERRRRLECALAKPTGLLLSPRLEADTWQALAAWRASSRERGAEGLMLKQGAAPYGSGRRKQDLESGGGAAWWKWKLEPMSVDCVLVYAQRGHGRRASLYTDYSFAVWSRRPHDAAEAAAVVEAIARREAPTPGALQLVPFAKAYSGLTDEEFRAVDRNIRSHTLEKFGPVRSVRPSLVFELGFEGIQRSARHKSGIAVRFPRMLRLRPDKPLWEADTQETLEALIAATGGAL